ncbi:hypothetical protein [Streptomyces antarcticus]|uniref:hypothetical protein n=1 Tax=Streptomyces antarcticus TaxID=2996458 RepID=UPI00226F70E7|nr:MULTISPECIES: hypothetical protein [unclassified Streptomyces]MCY0942011.1 hypothetical protein [Streptomyces sp. H34-AA3]MCZ4082350.1 hypothetical protein [Streptomyces sp. H34-S5]
METAEGYAVLAETVKAVKESVAPDPNERLAKIEHLMQGYGLARERTFYQVESRFTHPTLTGAQMFFKDDGEAFHVSQHRCTMRSWPASRTAFGSSTSMLAFNEVLTDQPWTAELAKIAEEYGFMTALPQWQGAEDLHAP